ncbi:dual specificity protein phosphatase family protein [Paragemmobacter straminiformis]|uniref:Dual specificity protein phosphatase family protein n=1 Tax=Paragemmobacter straminiformis TaxID=2045119 RepID=A0A842I5Q2_9RHOB|nr:dual specificity protein phosphatase family protein [Gemmobacter straminiformis]MBC2834697.1 dual specificity protein phosphatase family protein [Gemmobacter straminiformis]
MAVLSVGGGAVMVAPCAGRGGDFAGDLAAWLDWGPALVVSMTTAAEMERVGAGGMGRALGAAGVAWLHCPVADYGVPDAGWDAVAPEIAATLARGGRVLVHCMGGCGRSGAAVLRLMVDAGEEPAAALARLRGVRPCAVETDAQFAWAARA